MPLLQNKMYGFREGYSMKDIALNVQLDLIQKWRPVTIIDFNICNIHENCAK